MPDLTLRERDARTTVRASGPPRARRARRAGRALTPLLWLGPSLILITVVVLWPVAEMARTSLLKISSSGVTLGGRGTGNYHDLFNEDDLIPVVLRTLGWVTGIVTITMVLSLAIGRLLNARFPGRRAVRWAVIVPWAASVRQRGVLMTSRRP